MKVTKKLFIAATVPSLKAGARLVDSVQMSEFDFVKHSKDYIHIDSFDVEFEMPEDVGSMAIDVLTEKLEKMRAEHHKAQQELIDSIAGLRLLHAPKEAVIGELLDDRDLANDKPKSSFSADDAEDVFPF